MDSLSLLPQTFLKARLDCINQELERLPCTSVGVHRGKPVIREIVFDNGLRKKQEYLVSSRKGSGLLRDCSKRATLLKEKRIVEKYLVNNDMTAGINLNKVITQFDSATWERLKAQSLDIDSNINYVHNGIRMRSRAEVLIAQVLDSLGLEYKYETKIVIDGDSYYPDFAVYLPEFRRFFFIEFLGMVDDKNYALKNGIKIGTYMNAGMRLNKDLLVFEGTQNTMPEIESITGDIVALINKYCLIYGDQ